MSNFYDLDVATLSAFHGQATFGASPNIVVLPDDFVTVLAAAAAVPALVTGVAALQGASASWMPASASASFIPASVMASMLTASAASAAYVHLPLPVADISPKGVIVLLSTLLGRVDAITDSLVAAGFMRYV